MCLTMTPSQAIQAECYSGIDATLPYVNCASRKGRKHFRTYCIFINTFLLSSDIRSEGSIAIVKKFDLDFLMIFDSISLPHPKNVFQKKSLSLSVSVCLYVYPSPTVVWCPLANISSRFLVFPLTLKLRVVHMRKKLKILILSKMAPTILTKFCGFIVHSKPNTMTLSPFPKYP